MAFFRKLGERLRDDYFRASRLREYEKMLATVRDQGYEVSSLLGFWERTAGGTKPAGAPILLLRHDVDTDPGGAEEMARVCARLGLSTTFYFRLSTLNVPLMRWIHEQGMEASYHFEELTTLIKARRLRTRDEVLAGLPTARALFERNLESLRRKTGLPMTTVAAHGDWINRRLNVHNSWITGDEALRKRTGVVLEAYDERFLRLIDTYVDPGHPRYHPMSELLAAVRSHHEVICVLIHPRQWRVQIWATTVSNLLRVRQTILYER